MIVGGGARQQRSLPNESKRINTPYYTKPTQEENKKAERHAHSCQSERINTESVPSATSTATQYAKKKTSHDTIRY